MKIGGGEKGKEQGAWSKEAVLSPQLAGGRDSILRSHSLTLLQGPLAWYAAESVVELSSPPAKGFLLVVGGDTNNGLAAGLVSSPPAKGFLLVVGGDTNNGHAAG